MKFKAKVKNNQLIVKVTIASSDTVSERELEALNVNLMRGFLKPRRSRKNVFEYTGPSGISLESYLKRNISEYEFLNIMTQITDMTLKVESYNLQLKNIVLDLRYVYINENTKELQFICVPLVNGSIYQDVLRFMESVIYAIPADKLEGDFAAKYAAFIKTLRGYDAAAIRNYLAEEDMAIARQIRRTNRGQSGFITNKQKEYYEHYAAKGTEESNGLAEDGEATGLLEEEETTALLEDGEATMLLAEEEEATCLLSENEGGGEVLHFPYMVRVTTNERVDINKPVFRIGKEKSYVDYFVANNQAVSRSHADIITRGKRYFVYDQNSTNHTYIDDKLLPVKVETEVFDGNIIRFANEEFVFHE